MSTPPSTPLIHITADLETVLGLHNHSAYLHGYGHLDPTTLREMARDATWQIIFTASRRYLDTLTDHDPPPQPEPLHTPHCTCTCGAQSRPRPTGTGTDTGMSTGGGTAAGRTLAEFLDRAANKHEQHTTSLPTRMKAPNAEQRADDRRRTALGNHTDDKPEPISAATDLIPGRTTTLPAGHLPDPPAPTDTNTPTGTLPRLTAGLLAEHYRTLVADDPTHSHAEYPDGHGGHHTPPPGALRYTPSATLAQWVRTQHPTCRHPGCTVPSVRCDLDHIVEFDHRNPEHGGWTIATNLGPFCRTHHNLKTSKLWTTERLPDDVIRTTDPHGNNYFSPPEL